MRRFLRSESAHSNLIVLYLCKFHDQDTNTAEELHERTEIIKINPPLVQDNNAFDQTVFRNDIINEGQQTI
ncbi:hypothetical protein CDAR_82461 [Caerostris darwini]|uniref:Uncharacterized protein n=1 Tax=Caerostris darwini TaxID=1538125 RepID=A0AAV4VZR6_9ARAC|nr:hypothetical protein CDAR_82461 [Caerostris darwini]